VIDPMWLDWTLKDWKEQLIRLKVAFALARECFRQMADDEMRMDDPWGDPILCLAGEAMYWKDKAREMAKEARSWRSESEKWQERWMKENENLEKVVGLPPGHYRASAKATKDGELCILVQTGEDK